MPNITPNELARLFPNASADPRRANQARGLASSPVSQPNPVDEPVAANAGEVDHPRRRSVRYTLFRVRIIDAENSGYTKHYTDALVRAGYLAGDSPDECEIQVTQKLVTFPAQERTEIEISDL